MPPDANWSGAQSFGLRFSLGSRRAPRSLRCACGSRQARSTASLEPRVYRRPPGAAVAQPHVREAGHEIVRGRVCQGNHRPTEDWVRSPRWERASLRRPIPNVGGVTRNSDVPREGNVAGHAATSSHERATDGPTGTGSQAVAQGARRKRTKVATRCADGLRPESRQRVMPKHVAQGRGDGTAQLRAGPQVVAAKSPGQRCPLAEATAEGRLAKSPDAASGTSASAGSMRAAAQSLTSILPLGTFDCA